MGESNQDTDLRLIQSIREGSNDSAKDQLVTKYLPMVKHIVRQQPCYFLEYEDLVQEGLIGLLKAIDEYRPDTYPVKFSTFAYICILRRIYNTIKMWQSKKCRVLSSAISLHGHPHAEDSKTLMETLEQPGMSPYDIVEEGWTNSRLKQVLEAHLSPVELAVIHLYMQGLNSTEIQERLNLNAKVVDNARTRVRQKLSRIVNRYGSLVSPKIPLKTRKRSDLAIPLQKLG